MEAFQALYRRYRPRRFGEVRGQDHVVRALRNAARDGRVGHAYLFSGPRGTGKTSTARILAKALNCEAPVDGEPCLECASCLSIEAGNSFDVHELDAASNNGVDAMRDLIAKVALATPGRTKVYILDEVHMLSPGAENAFLKTLEEPPPGVVFVLATTDPNKVRATIRSRTQHFDFRLLPAEELDAHARYVIADAGLDVDADGIDHAVRAGAGSARDMLSALDQLVAAGGVAEDTDVVDELVEALADRDTGRALVAVSAATAAGRDPRVLGERLVSRLRDVFLVAMKAGLDHLADRDRAQVVKLAERFDARSVTRALELLGQSLVDMHQAPDHRICLEVALVRLTNPSVDPSPTALIERIERLERALARQQHAPEPEPATPAPAPRPEPATKPPTAQPALGAIPVQVPAPAPPPEAPAPPAPRPVPRPAPAGDLPTRDELTLAWGDHVLNGIEGATRAILANGWFVRVEPDAAVFAIPPIHRARCEEYKARVEQALADHFGRPVPLRFVVEGDADAAPAITAAVADPVDEMIDPAELTDVPADNRSQLELLAEAFPGAEIVEETPP